MNTGRIRPRNHGLVAPFVLALLLGAPLDGLGSQGVEDNTGGTRAFEADAADAAGFLELLLPKPLKTGWKVATRVRTAFTNYQQCRARGASHERCAAVVVFCDIRENEILSRYHKWVSSLQPFEAFKLDCGTGICFQCCSRPGLGCHTSFEGFPVINCNETNYGLGTRPAGLTLLDPAAQPGNPCLFTPQVCDHIPLCVSGGGNSAAALPPDPLTSPEGIARRGRTFARWAGRDWAAYLNEYSTREPAATPGAGRSLSDLADFVTGRGCGDWRTKVSSEYPFDWTDELFAVRDANGQIVEAASHLNGVHQLGLMRLLASTPNVDGRLAYTDSRLWTEQEREAYLSQVGDPDLALLASMSPHALEVLKRNTAIQDYRLLAVPLAGEGGGSGLFNGCDLGRPPIVALKFRPVGMLGIRVALAVSDPGQDVPAESPLAVDWGDGRVDRFVLAPSQRSLNATHDYALGGRYIVHATMENDSGLRGLAAIVVKTKARGGAPAPTVPSAAQVAFEDLTSFLSTLTGQQYASLLFEVEAEDDAGEAHLVGLSEKLGVPFNQSVSYGNVVAHNEGRLPLRKLVIRPGAVDVVFIGFREWYFTVPRLTFRVHSTERNDFVSHSVRIVPEMLEVYQRGQTVPLPPEAIQLDANGNAKIPIIAPGNLWTDRVEIRLTDEMFAGFSLGPARGRWRVRDTKSWKEVRPAHFVPVL